MFEKFQDVTFKASSLELIAKCNKVINAYRAQGYTLTLRQLYYQMVARDIIPNTPRGYKNLGELVAKARMGGMIDWDAIEDRTRNVDHPAAWTSAQNILQGAADAYQENPWLVQDHHVEVWIEKEALVGVVEGICQELRLPLFACRGYASIWELYHSGKRLQTIALRRSGRGTARHAGREPVILHLGDHDPSGLDMTRDNRDRLAIFAGLGIKVERLALNMDQIEEYEPPPNPAKVTDSRFANYELEHGDESWELDALEPQVIVNLIRNAAKKYIDNSRWQSSMDQETSAKDNLQNITDNYEEIVEFLENKNEDGDADDTEE